LDCRVDPATKAGIEVAQGKYRMNFKIRDQRRFGRIRRRECRSVPSSDDSPKTSASPTLLGEISVCIRGTPIAIGRS
jgi:hypothetical protein